jgi:photosynthetic reaction center cytochrome c subunit
MPTSKIFWSPGASMRKVIDAQMDTAATQVFHQQLKAPRTMRSLMSSMLEAVVICVLVVASAGAQNESQQKPQMAEDVFKNVQLLRGITVNEFLETMGFFSASLNMNCVDCHAEEAGGDWARYADDTEKKQTTRKMILMMRGINQSYFGGKRIVTCYSCHRNGNSPVGTPNLAEVYGTPPLPDPVEIQQGSNTPSADQLLDKYLQARGGAQRLSAFTSFLGKGTYEGYGEGEKSQMDIFVKAPNQLTTVVHRITGDSVTSFDGRSGWIASPAANSPVTMIEMTGGDLDAAKVDANLFFPAQIKQALSKWRVGFATTIDDKDVQLVEGTTTRGVPVKLYFDPDSGLLVRQVRYIDTPMGFNPTQIDYADYRDVSGVKIPFRWTVTWLDGRSTYELTELRPNAPIDAAKFAKPPQSQLKPASR